MPRVFDCFPFFNEIDILSLRLHELDSAVDCFVIVESNEMHGSARTKAPVFESEACRKVIAPFLHKIFYMLLDKLQPEYTDARSGWQRENFQRAALMKPIKALRAKSDDIIIVSDCDEIPRARVVSACRNSNLTSIHKLNLDFFYYNVNNYVGPWAYSTIGTLAQYEAAGGFQTPRGTLDMPTAVKYPTIPNAGWHFSYFGGIDRIIYKAGNFAHSSDSFVRDTLARGTQQIADDIAAHRDLYHRKDVPEFSHRLSSDLNLPEYFLNNRERFTHFSEEETQ